MPAYSRPAYFYKDLSDPIITVTNLVASTPYNPNPNPPGAKP